MSSIWITIHDLGWALLTPLLDIVMLIASLAAAKNPVYRREFTCIAIACGLTTVSASIMLLIKWGTAFHFTPMHKDVGSAVLMLLYLTELASTPFYFFGFLSLTYRIYSQTSKK